MSKPNLNVVARTEIKIEKGIPLANMNSGTPRARKYPFPDMEPGDSFAIPNGLDAKKVTYAAYAYGDKHGRKYAVRKIADGSHRCWRVS